MYSILWLYEKNINLISHSVINTGPQTREQHNCIHFHAITLSVRYTVAPDESNSLTVSVLPSMTATMSGVFPYCRRGAKQLVEYKVRLFSYYLIPTLP